MQIAIGQKRPTDQDSSHNKSRSFKTMPISNTIDRKKNQNRALLIKTLFLCLYTIGIVYQFWQYQFNYLSAFFFNELFGLAKIWVKRLYLWIVWTRFSHERVILKTYYVIFQFRNFLPSYVQLTSSSRESVWNWPISSYASICKIINN